MSHYTVPISFFVILVGRIIRKTITITIALSSCTTIIKIYYLTYWFQFFFNIFPLTRSLCL